MISQREVTRRYNDIVECYKNEKPNGKNIYRCPNNHTMVTNDIDAGVTPFMKMCLKCHYMGTSSMYGYVPETLPIDAEWYRPTLKQALKMRDKPEMLEHVLNGGLEFRVVTPKKY